MNIPEELRYTREHEWIRAEEDGTATVGITQYAQDSLGDVTYVELPSAGSAYDAGEVFGVVESVKAASDLFLPVAGEVVAANDGLNDHPEWVNSDPYGQGWIIRLRPANPADLEALLDASAYRALID